MDPPDAPQPRSCHIFKWPDFDGYGFNLHAEKARNGQFIGKVDEESPAEMAGLREGDKIVEVNGVNISNENHRQVVERIKALPNETRLLVVDEQAERWYKERKMTIKSSQANVIFQKTPLPRPAPGSKAGEGEEEEVVVVVGDQVTTPDLHQTTAAAAVSVSSGATSNRSSVAESAKDEQVVVMVGSNHSNYNNNNNNNNSISVKGTQNNVDSMRPEVIEIQSNGEASPSARSSSPQSTMAPEVDPTTPPQVHQPPQQQQQQQQQHSVEKQLTGPKSNGQAPALGRPESLGSDGGKSEEAATASVPDSPASTKSSLSGSLGAGSGSLPRSGAGSSNAFEPPTNHSNSNSSNRNNNNGNNNNGKAPITGGDQLDLTLNMSAVQMREFLAAKKKKDPKKAQLDIKQKYEIIQQM